MLKKEPVPFEAFLLTLSYLGTTPETISGKLATLEEQGYIKQKAHNKIEILDVDRLLLI